MNIRVLGRGCVDELCMWVRKNCILNVEFVQRLKLGRCEVELCTCRTRDVCNSEPGFGGGMGCAKSRVWYVECGAMGRGNCGTM